MRLVDKRLPRGWPASRLDAFELMSIFRDRVGAKCREWKQNPVPAITLHVRKSNILRGHAIREAVYGPSHECRNITGFDNPP